MNESYVAARVEDLLRAEQLLEAWAVPDRAVIMSHLVGSECNEPAAVLKDLAIRSNQTILALLMMAHAAIRELAKEMDRDVDDVRTFLRIWLIEQMENKIPSADAGAGR